MSDVIFTGSLELSSLIPVATTIIGVIVGGFWNHWANTRDQEKKLEGLRGLALKALDVFEQYAENQKTYKDAEAEFNTKFNLSEKRAVVVALYKLGVPFDMSVDSESSLKELGFLNNKVDIHEVISMKEQVAKGNCDDLFFKDIDAEFGDRRRILRLRNVAVRYVNDVLLNSPAENGQLLLPSGWMDKFSFCELYNLMVFQGIVRDSSLWDERGKPKVEKMTQLVKDVESGMFDQYLLLEYHSFLNIKQQASFAEKCNILMDRQSNGVGAMDGGPKLVEK